MVEKARKPLTIMFYLNAIRSIYKPLVIIQGMLLEVDMESQQCDQQNNDKINKYSSTQSNLNIYKRC